MRAFTVQIHIRDTFPRHTVGLTTHKQIVLFEQKDNQHAMSNLLTTNISTD